VTFMTEHCSVIICSHNPRPQYLRRTFDALKQQALSPAKWELLLIDNVSEPALASKWDLSWHPNSRHVREETLGLTAARLRGIAEATGELLVFFDDDNVPDPNYLETAVNISHAHPQLGCWGAGVLEPDYEVEPAPEYRRWVGLLALRHMNHEIWANCPAELPRPWGAGLVVRRAVANHYMNSVTRSPLRTKLGRKGKKLSSGEDDEFSWCARELGLGYGIFTSLRITHLIPEARVHPTYLKCIAFENGYSSALLGTLHGLNRTQAFIAPRLSDAFKFLIQRRPVKALRSFTDWVEFMRESATDKVIIRARANGWDAAIADVTQNPKGEFAHATRISMSRSRV
jgi:Glycosyl transferase family 2